MCKIPPFEGDDAVNEHLHRTRRQHLVANLPLVTGRATIAYKTCYVKSHAPQKHRKNCSDFQQLLPPVGVRMYYYIVQHWLCGSGFSKALSHIAPFGRNIA